MFCNFRSNVAVLHFHAMKYFITRGVFFTVLNVPSNSESSPIFSKIRLRLLRFKATLASDGERSERLLFYTECKICLLHRVVQTSLMSVSSSVLG